MAEVYSDRSVKPVTDSDSEFVTEAPVPTVDEINTEPEFHAEIISADEFEKIYNSDHYPADICFPG